MSADREVPLYVDLDGSVVRTDTLWESFASALRRYPVRTFAALFALASGRAALKRRLAELGAPDVESLPLRDSLVAWLREQRSMGRRIVLATAADRVLAESVADRVGVFDQVLASDGHHNLKGRHKLAAIRSDAAGAPFDYCGNGPEDVAIFAAARCAIVVGAPQRVLRDARRRATVARGRPVRSRRSSMPVQSPAVVRAAGRDSPWVSACSMTSTPPGRSRWAARAATRRGIARPSALPP